MRTFDRLGGLKQNKGHNFVAFFSDVYLATVGIHLKSNQENRASRYINLSHIRSILH